MEERKLGRRGFLGLLTGAVAAAAAVPIIVPKKSFFSFFLPKQLEVPKITEVYVNPGESIAQAIARLDKSGGKIFVKAGAYIINETIVLPKDVMIVGESLNIVGCSVTSEPGRSSPMIRTGGENNTVDGCYFDLTGAEEGACALEITEDVKRLSFNTAHIVGNEKVSVYRIGAM